MPIPLAMFPANVVLASSVYISFISPSNFKEVLTEFSFGLSCANNYDFKTHLPFNFRVSSAVHVSDIHSWFKVSAGFG
jgi:hypothetical protein